MAGIEHASVIGDINPQSTATTMLKTSGPVELTWRVYCTCCTTLGWVVVTCYKYSGNAMLCVGKKWNTRDLPYYLDAGVARTSVLRRRVLFPQRLVSHFLSAVSVQAARTYFATYFIRTCPLHRGRKIFILAGMRTNTVRKLPVKRRIFRDDPRG